MTTITARRCLVLATVVLFAFASACKSKDKDKTEKSNNKSPIKQPAKTRVEPRPKPKPPAKTGDKQPPKKVVDKQPPPKPAAKLVGHDFLPEAQILFRTAACKGNAELPKVVAKKFLDAQCKFLSYWIAYYKRVWLDKAMPFFAKLVPANLGTEIVYPFGGGDLMTALAVFPKLTQVTTLSLEPSGDPRTINTIKRGHFMRYWTRARKFIGSYFRANHSRTVDMIEAMNYGKLPGIVIFSLVGLSIHDMEPVSLRYFAIETDGKIRYYTSADFTAADEAVKSAKKHGERKRAEAARRDMFRHMELRFRKAGTTGPIKVHRHIRANLGNKALKKDRRVIAHLEAKGKVPCMTKAASYLLWHDAFSIIRDYLSKHLTWMVSDATGIPPRHAKKANLEQITYGRFNSHIRTMGNPGPRTIADFRKLWASQKLRPVPFRFGYSGGFDFRLWHLMVTRPKS